MIDLTASEVQVLGACLAFPAEAVSVARSHVGPEDFGAEAGRTLFGTILALWDSEGALDLPMLSAALRRQGRLDLVGGDADLTGLHDAVGTAATTRYHACEVRKAGDRRRLVEVMTHALAELQTDGRDLRDLQASLLDRIARVCTARPAETIIKPKELVALFDGFSIPGLPTGLKPLDDAIDGLQPGHLIVLAGRPGIGKTSLAEMWACHVTEDPEAQTLFVSCEMSPKEIARWFIALVAHVTRSAVGPAVLETVRASIEGRGFFVTAPTAPTIGEVQGAIRAGVAAHDVRLAFVDHLGKLRAPGAESRTQEVGAVARGLKAIAKELAIPVVALCQLNRDSERRDVRRPRLADLRDSGEVEQEADIVAFLWTQEERPLADLPVKLTLAKNRHGQTGEWDLLFRRPLGRFDVVNGRAEGDDR